MRKLEKQPITMLLDVIDGHQTVVALRTNKRFVLVDNTANKSTGM